MLPFLVVPVEVEVLNTVLHRVAAHCPGDQRAGAAQVVRDITNQVRQSYSPLNVCFYLLLFIEFLDPI